MHSERAKSILCGSKCTSPKRVYQEKNKKTPLHYQNVIGYVMKRWLQGATTNLQPCPSKIAFMTFNNCPDQQLKNRTPMQVASMSDIHTNQKHFHTFSGHTYVLQTELQQDKPFGMQRDRSDVGIYLGPLPHHNGNMGLILNQKLDWQAHNST